VLFNKTEARQTQESVVNLSHPPILQAVKVKQKGVLTKGTILGLDEATGEYDLLDNHTVVAVLTKDIDTDIDEIAQVLRHGVLNSQLMEISKLEIALLAKNNIYIF
jgi:hypothetical protein